MKTNAPTRDLFPELLEPEDDVSVPGLYFFTICMDPGAPALAKISGDTVKPNAIGRAVEAHWQSLPRIFGTVRLEAFTLMPDHIHGIIAIEDGSQHSLVAVLRTFKSVSARAINKRRQTPGHPLWQWGHEEHVLRDVAALEKMRNFITVAPMHWQADRKDPLTRKFRRRSGQTLSRIAGKMPRVPAFPHKIHAALRRT